MLADKHARYISEIAYLVGEVEKVTNELGDNGAIVASITVFVNAPPLYLPRRYAIANARDCPRCLVRCRENGGQQVMFSGIFMSY